VKKLANIRPEAKIKQFPFLETPLSPLSNQSQKPTKSSPSSAKSKIAFHKVVVVQSANETRTMSGYNHPLAHFYPNHPDHKVPPKNAMLEEFSYMISV
jgi:hypothetical protein